MNFDPSRNSRLAAAYIMTLPKAELVCGQKRARYLAEKIGVPVGAIDKVIRVARRDASLLPEVACGRMKLNEAQRRVGLITGDEVKKERRAAKRGIRPDGELTLSAREARIEGNIELFVSLARDLYSIREERLYLEEYGEWDRYLRERWGIPFSDFYAVTVAVDAPIIAVIQRSRNHVR